MKLALAIGLTGIRGPEGIIVLLDLFDPDSSNKTIKWIVLLYRSGIVNDKPAYWNESSVLLRMA